MAFLDKTGLQNLTNKLVQGDAIKVASLKGTTVKEVIDNIQRECENIALPNTMIIENRVNKFRIGQGRDINVSRDVEEGFSQITLKGQTYQNLCGYNAWFEAPSQYISNFNCEDYNDKIVVTKLNNNNEGWRYLRNKTLKSKMLKPNTKYTLFFKYETNFNNVPSIQFMCGSATEQLSDYYVSKKIKDNVYMCVLTTLESFANKQIGAQVIYFHYATPNKIGDRIALYKDMVLLEGDYSQTPIDEMPQYFEGIQSSFENKVANISIQSKNIFDYREYIKDSQTVVHSDINGFYYNCNAETLYNGYIVSASVEPNTVYSLSAERVGAATHTRLEIGIKDHEGHKKIFDTGYQSAPRTILTFKTPNQVGIDGRIYFKIWSTIYNGSKHIINSFIGVANIQLEAGEPTSFEPYYNHSYKFDIKESLRKLPNGVCDEIRNNNGHWELIRRIKKVTFNGNEPWAFHSMVFGNKEGVRCILDLSDLKPAIDSTISLFCDKLIIGCDSAAFLDKNDTANAIFNRIDLNRGALYVTIMMKDCNVAADDTPSTKATKVQKWLQANPITVYYELKTPIITTIDPIQFHVSKGANLNIDSDIAPLSVHEVVLNRTGQIEQSVELIADLRNRIDKLEKVNDSNLIAIQYRLNNLKLNYELEREEA